MDPNLVILLVILPLAAAILSSLVRVWVALQRLAGLVSIAGCVGLAARMLWEVRDGGLLVAQVGGWPAPFGISVVFDALSGLLILTANVVAFACYLHSFGSLDERLERGWYHPLFHLVLMGVNLSFITGDLFNLFVAFEVLLLASYALLCLGSSREQLSQAYKYVMLNLIGSTVFVLGAGLVYGMMGTLNFADLAATVAGLQAAGEPLPAGFDAVAMMLLFVFALKAAIFPLWFWLPDTYHTCPIAICALFGGLLTKVGVYALFRIFPMIFAAPGLRDAGFISILATVAIASMILGILGALAMRRIRRLLTLALVSHIGYFAFGAALMSSAALAGAVFYMAQHMLVMAELFLCCGVIEAICGTDDMSRTGGLARRAPWLATIFFIAALSLSGLPPTSGFYGKLMLITEGFVFSGDGMWLLSAAGLFTTLLTIAAMAKVWRNAFWSTPSDEKVDSEEEGARAPDAARLATMYAGAIILVAASLLMALFAEPMTRLSESAVATANEPRRYAVAVLGEDAWPGGETIEADVETASAEEGEATP